MPPPYTLSTVWPRSSNFEDGTPGATVTPENSIVGGFHYDEGGEYDWEAVFSNVEARFGSVSITSLPDSYEILHFPFGPDPVTNVAVDDFFWFKYDANGVEYASSTATQTYVAPLGVQRNYDYDGYPGRVFVEYENLTHNRWWVEFEDASIPGMDAATQFSFLIPNNTWVKVRVQISLDGDLAYTVTEESGTVHGPFSSPHDNLLTLLYPATQYFAMHQVYVTQAAGYGEMYLDAVNYEGVSGPVKRAIPGTANVRVDVTAKANEIPEQALTVPGGLYPMMARAFEIDEYRLMRGWPMPVPPMDIHCTTMVSADGEVITARDQPSAIKTNALLRWTADPDSLNQDALRWEPVQNATGAPANWETGVSNMPVEIPDYEYRVGDERFYRPALNFDSDNATFMRADFSTTIGGASGFSVIFVMSPNSVYGNNQAIPYNGLFCPDDDTENWFSLTTQGRYLYLETESMPRTRTISIAPGLDVAAPLMIGVVFDRPETTLYVGQGPSSMRVFSMPTGSVAQTLPNKWLLGATGEAGRTADMALMDLGIYANRLSAPQMADEFSLLSASYGGDL